MREDRVDRRPYPLAPDTAQPRAGGEAMQGRRCPSSNWENALGAPGSRPPLVATRNSYTRQMHARQIPHIPQHTIAPHVSVWTPTAPHPMSPEPTCPKIAVGNGARGARGKTQPQQSADGPAGCAYATAGGPRHMSDRSLYRPLWTEGTCGMYSRTKRGRALAQPRWGRVEQ